MITDEIKMDYKDIEVACIFIGSTNPAQTVFRNVAEINKHLDKEGNDITDRDSTPNNVTPDEYDVNDNEDDDDYELITLVISSGVTSLSDDLIVIPSLS